MSKAHQPDRMPGYTLPRYPYRTPPELAGGKPPDAAPYPVIIAGAGLGGLTAALELACRGVRTVILDDDDTVGASGLSSRGICYAKRTLELLERFGVAARIRAKGVTWNEGDVFRGAERIYRFNLQPEKDQAYPAFVNLQQFYVEQYLVEALARHPAADLRWRNQVIDVAQGRDYVTVKARTPEGIYTLRGRYLIGADGAHSVVRRKLGARDAESALFDTAWCIADVKMRADEAPVRKAYLDSPLNDGGAIWYHQMADGVWRTDWQISHYDDPDAEATPARARRRLRKLLGPKATFELVWVGPWRFRRRWLEKMVHGRVLFLGDAAAQHSPFGARGGNRAIQDANNLAWKLALVLEGRAHPDLLQTYDAERHAAAVESVEIASRSAIFISPESPGQRVFRDAVLDLAQRDPAARELVNVGRLSTACAYADSPLNGAESGFDSPLAKPGAAAPDGRLDKGHLVGRLQGEFSVVYFGNRGPQVDGTRTLHVPRSARTAPLFARYAVPKEGATYVFRPDGHVLARSRGVAGEFALQAVNAVLAYRTAPRRPQGAPSTVRETAPPTVHERDRLYDALARLYDRAPAKARDRLLGRMVVALARQLPPQAALAALADAGAGAGADANASAGARARRRRTRAS
jgi:3-(3-hydroxy-phenyl)propionate hydroxylase